MKFAEQTIETPEGSSLLLVATPDENVSVGRERLAELRASTTQGEIDKQIIWEIEQRKGRVRALMLRCRNDDGAVTWGFDESLREDEALELGYLLIKSQVPTYRSFVENGVQGHFVVELGDREARALNIGKMQLVAELSDQLERLPKDDPRASVLLFHTWLLQNFMYRLHLDASETIDIFLPRSLPILEGGRKAVELMLAGLPDEDE
jgi:hypothetical protein